MLVFVNFLLKITYITIRFFPQKIKNFKKRMCVFMELIKSTKKQQADLNEIYTKQVVMNRLTGKVDTFII